MVVLCGKTRCDLSLGYARICLRAPLITPSSEFWRQQFQWLTDAKFRNTPVFRGAYIKLKDLVRWMVLGLAGWEMPILPHGDTGTATESG